MQASVKRYLISPAADETRPRADLEKALRAAGVDVDSSYTASPAGASAPTLRGTADDAAVAKARAQGFTLYPDLPFGAF